MKTLIISALLVLSQSTLFAQAPAAAPAPSPWSSLIGIGLMFVVFFVFFIWPQARKAKKHTEFISKLQKGDAVVTQSGLYGRISGIADKVVTLEIAPNVRIRVDRQTISGLDTTGGDRAAA